MMQGLIHKHLPILLSLLTYNIIGYRRISLPVAEHKVMVDEEVVNVDNDERQWVVPRETVKKAPGDNTDHSTSNDKSPENAQNSHVAILVALVGLGVTRSCPEEFNVEEAILDGGEVGVALDCHHMLYVEAVLSLRPYAHENNTVENRGNGKGKVPELEPFRTDGKQKSTCDRGQEDVKRDGRVVEET